MTGHLGLHRNFLIINAVTILCAAAKTSHRASFHRLSIDQERFSSPFRTVGNASGLQCSAACHEEAGCLAFNHNAVTGDCELINSSELQLETLFTQDFGWTVYRKGKCNHFVGYITT